eukprot:TRINITY_DN13419_c0_g1_i1.p1 TRINITY_DN13419_c0_g1~~TRINITY_DN13419_c0_g1_i1.p1  ORF type:complete len:382 (+),score=81.91 TRINITY_DN13419_c0_g1_i1:33-1148(+)
MATEVRPVTCATVHSWNKDRSQVAVCPNSKEIHIYKAGGPDVSTWELLHVLIGHDQIVTGIDWAANTNRILSCSQDRNAYVWNFDKGLWKPTLVLLRMSRAATCCKWSPKEDKFAVGSSAKLVAICHFEEENNWWVSKTVKKHNSTVLAIAWHPSNVLIATASSDFRARIFSAVVRGVDKRTGHDTPFGDKLGFGECLAEFPARGWVHSVAFSPSGNRLAFVAHDASVSFVQLAAGAQPVIQTQKLKALPLRSIIFSGENVAVGGGHGNGPLVFVNKSGQWEDARELDTGAGAMQAIAKKQSAVSATLSMFQQTATRGQARTDVDLKTIHQNAIVTVNTFGAGRLTTTALDGRIVTWELNTISEAMAALKV